MWDKLILVMTALVDAYRVILTNSSSKKRILIAADVDKLEALTKEEENLILKIGKLEAAREQIAAELAGLYAISPQDFTLEKAKELAGGETTDKLQALETELVTIINELAPLNKTNTELIQQSLNYVNYNLNMLTQSPAGTNYAPKGQGESTQPRAVIDAKI